MADKIKGSVCLNHPNTPAVAHCAVCRKPVCKECVKIFDGTSFCSRECYEKSLKTGKMVEEVVEKRNAVETKRMIRNIIIIIVHYCNPVITLFSIALIALSLIYKFPL